MWAVKTCLPVGKHHPRRAPRLVGTPAGKEIKNFVSGNIHPRAVFSGIYLQPSRLNVEENPRIHPNLCFTIYGIIIKALVTIISIICVA